MARLCGMAPIASTDHSYKLSVASNAQQCWLDERQWYTWNRIQSIQWIAQQVISKEDQEEKGMVVSILASHYITGEVLDGLADVSQLVALKVPFGPACRLSNSIVGLIERYPKPRILNGIRQRTRRTDSVTKGRPPYGVAVSFHQIFEPIDNRSEDAINNFRRGLENQGKILTCHVEV